MADQLPRAYPKSAIATDPMTRTARGLRDALFDEIDAIRKGTGDPQRALAVSKVAGQIINIAKAEMEFHKLAKGEGPEDLVERAKVTAIPSATKE